MKSAGVVDGRPAPGVSVVVTIDNGAAPLEELYERTVAALGPQGRAFELIFVDDGSVDGTFATLERLYAGDGRVRAVRFKRNVGQHLALHAGLSRALGEIIVTMDGALQSAPEDIPRLVSAVEGGFDVASGRRTAEPDSGRPATGSRLINGMLCRFTGVRISDPGCVFNAYRREAVMPMLGAIGKHRFTKALVLTGGASVVEVDLTPSPRPGRSHSSPFPQTRLALQVLAGFWAQPIQLIGIALGIVCTLAATAVGAYGIGFWIDESNFPGPLFGGAAILAVLGIQGFILALIGEYLTRIQRDVERRPLYTIDREL